MYSKIILVIVYIICVSGSGIYHENTKWTFSSNSDVELFGFSVVLNHYSLIVGAPKAWNKDKQTGLAFNCSLEYLDDSKKPIRCSPIGPALKRNMYSRLVPDSFYSDDMWFGATIASLTGGKTLICAPRFSEPHGSKHLLSHGLCSLRWKGRDSLIYPLSERPRQAFMTDGKRREYGDYGTHLNFYAYGQAGMSIKVVENSSVIIGAPGLLQWTGGIINYIYNPHEESSYLSKQIITNPYYTQDLGPDDYFGYSVEAGVFNPGSEPLYIGGAPRSKKGFGQVFIFEPATREQYPLKIRAKLQGPQLGSYFGASLCCLDIDGDGISDLLVGAPNYVVKDGGLPYDQGAVFVYMTKLNGSNTFYLEGSGKLMGSGASGARFGTAMADLGDVDGDGFRDVAVGSPWENDGTGVVYIYRGYAKGLKSQYVQKIVAEGAKSFGISISKGVDVDHNNCNDLAIGAAKSETAYIYRCVPSIVVHASIKVPDAMNLPHNATGFTALFCVSASKRPLWPNVKAEFKTRIVVDPEENRAMITENSQYTVSIIPGGTRCDEKNVTVKPTADLSKPISMKFFLEPEELLKSNATTFNRHAARVSEDSKLESLFLIQLIRDCGEDMICTPWLEMSLDALNPTYIPGTDGRLGAKLTILNTEEPAYGARVNITLPLTPKRQPSGCSLEDLILTCDVPAPLFRGQDVTWEIELEYKESEESMLKITAELDDPLYNRNISKDSVKEVTLTVHPEAKLNVVGKPLPNETIQVTREKLNEAEGIYFSHYIEISNFGPSNMISLHFTVELSETVNLSTQIEDCEEASNGTQLYCIWYLPAKVSRSVSLPLRFDLAKHGTLLKDSTRLNISAEVIILTDTSGNTTTLITTTLVLDPAPPIWPLILGVVSGLILLAAIVYLLYKCGFFLSQKRQRLKELQEQTQPLTEAMAGSSTDPPAIDADGSTQELLCDSE